MGVNESSKNWVSTAVVNQKNELILLLFNKLFRDNILNNDVLFTMILFLKEDLLYRADQSNKDSVI